LYDLLPFLSTVIFQNGIYWIKEFLLHEASQLLLSMMPPDYKRWSALARQEVESTTHTRNDTLIQTSNEAAQQAFSHLLGEVKVIRHAQQQLTGEIRDICNNVHQHEEPTMGSAAGTVQGMQQQQPDRGPRRSVHEVLRNTPQIPFSPADLPSSLW